MADSQPPQRRGRRVAGEVDHVQHRRLGAAQPPAVDRLEHRRVPKRRQPPLRPDDAAVHRVVDDVEQPLQLARVTAADVAAGPRSRRHARPGCPRGRSGAGTAPTRCSALLRPPVPRIPHVVEKAADRALVGPHRRMGPPVGRHPPLQVVLPPRPRPGLGELHEPAHHPLAVTDDRRTQPAGLLLPGPPRQQLLQQRLLGCLRGGRAHQRQPCRARRRSVQPATLHQGVRRLIASSNATELDDASLHLLQRGRGRWPLTSHHALRSCPPSEDVEPPNGLRSPRNCHHTICGTCIRCNFAHSRRGDGRVPQ